MAISFNQLFNKKSDYKIKDFPDLPKIEGLQLSWASADLYKKK